MKFTYQTSNKQRTHINQNAEKEQTEHNTLIYNRKRKRMKKNWSKSILRRMFFTLNFCGFSIMNRQRCVRVYCIRMYVGFVCLPFYGKLNRMQLQLKSNEKEFLNSNVWWDRARFHIANDCVYWLPLLLKSVLWIHFVFRSSCIFHFSILWGDDDFDRKNFYNRVFYCIVIHNLDCNWMMIESQNP